MDIKKPLVNYSGVVGELLTDDIHINKGSHYLVFNNTGSTIAAGTLVMATGTTGNSGQITIAAWDGSAPSKYIMGLVLADIPDDTDGVCVEFGPLRGIQTDGGNYNETWVDGEILFAGASGGLTKVQPTAPNTKTTLAIVINSHATNGTLLVRPTFGSNLGEDELVELSTLTEGDILQYNATSERFENAALSLHIDGGYANSLYTAPQIIDGGSA